MRVSVLSTRVFVASTLCVVLLLPACIVAQSCIPAHYKTNATRVEGKLNVHLVPHTHDDSGWLKTMDQYYYGSNNKIQLAAVQYILDTVVQALEANPDRRFVYGEMSFFTRWWREQTDSTKELVKKLVDRGQLDFVNGGYVQHDEAAAHYVAMIDQTTRGHSFLKEEFGKVPSIGWQLDPFGHSSTHAALMCGYLGFDGLFFGRADYQDMNKRKDKKQMEVLWRGAKSFGDSADVFTANFPTGNYGAPGGFWYDPWSQDDPIMDDKCLFDYNVQNRVNDFVKASQDLASVTYGDDILIPFGSDFQWISAHQYYKNVDKLIHHINEDGRINAVYSTPADYVAVKHKYNHSWPLKTDDFFPYADCPVCYWTGYFTSRATSKGWIREATAYLQAARQLEVLTGLGPSSTGPSARAESRCGDSKGPSTVGLSSKGPSVRAGGSRTDSKGPSTDSLEEAVSLLQHHDAITGTEKQHVTDDYHIRLGRGWRESQKLFTDALAHLITANSSAHARDQQLRQHAQSSSRKLQAASTLHTSNSQQAIIAPLEKASLKAAAAQSTAGTAGSADNSNMNASQTPADIAANAAHQTASDKVQTSADAESAAATNEQSSSHGTCAANEATTVCTDKAQPALMPQLWERPEQKSDSDLVLHQCQLLNASVCEPSVQLSKQGKGFLVVVYNALAWERPTEPIRVPIDVNDDSAKQWVVTGPDGSEVTSQVVPVGDATKNLQSVMAKEGALLHLEHSAQHELVFLAHLPPVGYASYFVTPHSGDTNHKAAAMSTEEVYTYPEGELTLHEATRKEHAPSHSVTEDNSEKVLRDSVTLDNGLLELNFSRTTGKLHSLQNRQAGVTANVTLDLSAYLSGDQNAGGEVGPPSGAYIFRPDGLTVPTALLKLHVIRGPVLSEVHQTFLDYTTATIRLWEKALHVEVEWTVGPIPIEDKRGKEVVLRYTSSLQSGDTFYTDSNGREYLKRIRDFRPTWNLTVTEPVSGNYYPLTAAAYIKEEGQAELTVLTDRAQGGASLASGQLEVMLHRRTLFDDQRGVAEPLNETMQGCMNCPSVGLIARGRHWLSLQDPDSAALTRRTFQQRLNDPLILSFGALPAEARAGALQDSGLRLQYSAVKAALPFNLHLLTFKALPEGDVLLRLAHLYQVDEHSDLAKPASVKLQNLFPSLKLSEVSELSLSANQLQTDVQRLKWQAGKSLSSDATDEPVQVPFHPAVSCSGATCANEDLTATLNPMEIKTFLLKDAGASDLC